MSASSAPLSTLEGPGSVSGAPNLPKCFQVDSAVFPYAQPLKLRVSTQRRTMDTAMSCWKHLEEFL